MKAKYDNGGSVLVPWPNQWMEQTAASVRIRLVAAAVHPRR